jgi:hypothetical protein
MNSQSGTDFVSPMAKKNWFLGICREPSLRPLSPPIRNATNRGQCQQNGDPMFMCPVHDGHDQAGTQDSNNEREQASFVSHASP